ncbi:MAG: hypothetical protein QM576_20855 [Rhodopseudomonas sp.]
MTFAQMRARTRNVGPEVRCTFAASHRLPESKLFASAITVAHARVES